MATTVDKGRYRGGFWALIFTQFQGAFSDNLFRWVLIYFLLRTSIDGDAGSEMERTGLVMGLSGALFSLPYIIFPGIFGALSDRFSKQRVAFATKVLELAIMTFGFAGLLSGNVYFLWTIWFLLSTQSAIFSPAKYGILPEILPDSRLSWGNGIMQMGTTVAIISGTAVAGPLYEFLAKADQVHLVSVILMGLALAGIISSTRITNPPAANPDQKLTFNPVMDLPKHFRVFRRDKWLFLTVLGWTFFWFAGVLLQQNILSLGHLELHLTETQQSVLQAVLAVGIALGSLSAGFLSRDKIEVGLIPLGAFGMTLFSALLGIQGFEILSVRFLLFGLGFFAGVFFVPLAATLQQRSPAEMKGGIMATSNMLSSVGILAASGLFMLLGKLHIGPHLTFLITACLTLATGLYISFVLPVFVVRLGLWVLSNTIYRLNVRGKHHVPEHGGALLVANHTSFLDALVIIASIDRPVRFIMYQGIYDIPWIKPLAKMMGAIPVTPGGGPREVVSSLRSASEAIKNGDLVCIFAEGQITRTGQMLPFRRGFERIMKGVEAPIVPVYIDQIWGSIFSFANGRFFWKWPKRVPYPITIAFGSSLASTANAYELRGAIQELGTRAYTERISPDDLLHRQFIRIARWNPFQMCVADGRSGKLSYFKTLVGSIILARKLKPMLGPEQSVGVLMPQGVGGVLVNVALTLMGKVPVNLNYTSSNDSIAAAARQCGMTHVITAHAFLEQLPVVPPTDDVIYLEDVMKTVGRRDHRSGALSAFFKPVRRLERELGAPATRSCDDLATIIFSSGSEGEPKGIMLTHFNIISNVDAAIQIFPHRKWDTMVGILPFFHSFGYTATLWAVLTQKLSAVYHPNPLEAKQIGDLIHQYEGKILFSTSTFLQNFIRRCSAKQLSSLETIVTGAEKLAPRVRDAFKEKFGVEPLEGYGTSECAPIVSLNIPDFRAPGFYQKGTKRGTIGHPIPGVSVRIVDPDSREVLQNGYAGILMVKGPNVMKGYLNQPEKTQDVLKDGWYETGDIATIDEDGFITITDRLARFSKIAGEMVSHTVVEEALQKLTGNPDRKLAVAGVPDPTKGERLIVIHTLDDEEFDELMCKLDDTGLPNLWVPKQKAFYKIDEIPVLGTGKMDLKAVKNLARQLDIGD